jgi:hypothetical protein
MRNGAFHFIFFFFFFFFFFFSFFLFLICWRQGGRRLRQRRRQQQRRRTCAACMWETWTTAPRQKSCKRILPAAAPSTESPFCATNGRENPKDMREKLFVGFPQTFLLCNCFALQICDVCEAGKCRQRRFAQRNDVSRTSDQSDSEAHECACCSVALWRTRKRRTSCIW